MEQIEESKKILNQLEAKLRNIDEWIQERKKEKEDAERELETYNKCIEAKKKEKEDAERELDNIIFEKAELESVLGKCHRDVCEYRKEFEHIKTKHMNKLEGLSEGNFHFFLSYQKNYVHNGIGVIESHQAVIKQRQFCWWGKFSKERTSGDDYKALEPFGESMVIDENSLVLRSLKENVAKRVSNNDNVYLFIYNPNPPDIMLHVANVNGFCYGKETVPVRELTNVAEEFTNLLNCFTNDAINFAVPILYPLVVTQLKEKFYFGELKSPVKHPEGFRLIIKSKEKGRTKREKVLAFFNKLNSFCGDCFVVIESAGCPPACSSRPEVMPNGETDQILLRLPKGYRHDNKAVEFRIYLDAKTSPIQKETVKQLISDYLK